MLQRIMHEGVWITNKRTGQRCLTLINHDMTFNARDPAPVNTLREMNYEFAWGEMLGYWRACDNAVDFEKAGTKTWYFNANETEGWLKNPHRKGPNDLGIIYGGIARNWPVHGVQGKTLDLYRSVYENILAGDDDRGQIITFWNPGMHHLGALRACMYEYQFSLLGDDLYVNSTQRSADTALGVAANIVQCHSMLHLMARITKKNPMRAFHRMVNCHIYENQMEAVEKMLARDDIPLKTGEGMLSISDRIQTFEDVEKIMTPRDFILTPYESHPKIYVPYAA